jgi:hypothetical protein
MRYISVRVVDSTGRPKYYSRVVLEINQFLANGVKEAHTDGDGLAQFQLDVDDGAEITVYVDGTESISRGPIRADYKVAV